MAPTKKDMVYFEESPDFCDLDTQSKYSFGGMFVLSLLSNFHRYMNAGNFQPHKLLDVHYYAFSAEYMKPTAHQTQVYNL